MAVDGTNGKDLLYILEDMLFCLSIVLCITTCGIIKGRVNLWSIEIKINDI